MTIGKNNYEKGKTYQMKDRNGNINPYVFTNGLIASIKKGMLSLAVSEEVKKSGIKKTETVTGK